MAGGQAQRGPSRVRDIARFSLGIEAAAISAAATTQAKHLILDTIGCAVAALAEDEALATVRAVAGQGGAPQASVIGGGFKTSAPLAALANGALLRFLDLNDFMMDRQALGATVGGHPSDNIGPVLAVAEWRGASGAETLAAIAAAYEVYVRLGRLMDRTRGWDTTSVSAFAVAAAAGRLMGLDEESLCHAIALAGTRAATPGVVRSGDISAAKFLANAMIASDAVGAAALAEHGLTGPLEIFEHERGLGAMFDMSRDADGRALARPLAEAPALMMAAIKAYPCLATGQTVAAAGIALAAKVKGRLGEIRAITVTQADAPIIVRQQADPGRLDPRSREAADHSFPFLAAVGLIDGRLTPRTFDDERWHAPQVRALMARMRFAVDADLAARAPGGYPARMAIDMADGSRFDTEVLAAPGMAPGGVPEAAIIAKFDAVTDGILAPARRDEIKAMVLALERQATIGPLMETLTRPPG